MKLDVHQLDLRLVHPWKIARSERAAFQAVAVVELTDADGVICRGEAAPVARYDESIATVEAFCRNVDPQRLSFDRVSESMDYLNALSAGDKSVKCAFNIALLDGAAKRAGKLLHNYLGLGFRENKHVTSFTIGIDEPGVIRQKVLAAEKYPVLKMKVGVPQDKRNLQSLREAAPTKPIRVDANEGWRTKEQALEMIEFLAADGRVEFVEQPMPATAPVSDWAWLKARSPLPIFGDESYHVATDAQTCAECFHGVNIKLVKTGGVSAAFDSLQAARKAGLKTMIGCMIETSILISAAAHLAELADHLDLDGNLLINNDPYLGVTETNGVLSFARTLEKSGLGISLKSH